jgi:hypothetical protein
LGEGGGDETGGIDLVPTVETDGFDLFQDDLGGAEVSRAIRMEKKPVVMPVNKAAQVVPITPMPIVTSIIEKPANVRRSRELSDRLILINSIFRQSYL